MVLIMNYLLTFDLIGYVCNKFDWFIVLLGLFCTFVFWFMLLAVILENVESKIQHNDLDESGDNL